MLKTKIKSTFGTVYQQSRGTNAPLALRPLPDAHDHESAGLAPSDFGAWLQRHKAESPESIYIRLQKLVFPLHAGNAIASIPATLGSLVTRQSRV